MFSFESKILVVDDMMTMRKLVQKALKEIGFKTMTEAADGQKAWEALNTDPTYHLIISDWNMPNCTGLDLLKRVRQDSRMKALPFVLLTAESEKGQVVEALKAGVSGYIVKPFTVDALKTQLEAIHKKVTAAQISLEAHFQSK